MCFLNSKFIWLLGKKSRIFIGLSINDDDLEGNQTKAVGDMDSILAEDTNARQRPHRLCDMFDPMLDIRSSRLANANGADSVHFPIPRKTTLSLARNESVDLG